MKGAVDIEENDTVVDVGAYVGETAEYAAEKASCVLAVEPSPITGPLLRHNMAPHDNVIVKNVAAWFENTTLTFKIGDDNSEDSALDIDSGQIVTEKEVPGRTLESIAKSHNIQTIDYLKIEAEGAEPEVLRGLGDLDVEKIVVNARKERYGESTKDKVTELLTERGFKVLVDPKKDKYMVFAKQNFDSTAAE